MIERGKIGWRSTLLGPTNFPVNQVLDRKEKKQGVRSSFFTHVDDSLMLNLSRMKMRPLCFLTVKDSMRCKYMAKMIKC